ncbi:MAG: hypothetical protein EHM28_09370 [Spirochaetaceae bacterium]|nr:MAG: hypothetical protein EHM28_09370 [Spirochaetaceae bacterium]
MPHTRIFCLISLLLTFIAISGLYAQNITIAFAVMENSSREPRYDYLEGIISGILLHDLSMSQEIGIVERGQLSRVLAEQELQLSDLAISGTSAGNNAVRIGKILGAKFLLSGMYSVLGTDVSITVQIIDVQTAKLIPFTQRGMNENTIHALSQQIIRQLTGKNLELVSESGTRSILSLRDEKPGSIQLYCGLQKAEIFLDNEFAGYTNGDPYTPVKLENLRPGQHTIRVHLAGFGEIRMPEVVFADWERVVTVVPGGQHAVRSDARMGWAAVDMVRILVDGNLRLEFKDRVATAQKNHPLLFTDRNGIENKGTLSVEVSVEKGQTRVIFKFTVSGKTETRTVTCMRGEEETLSFKNGLLEFRIKVVYNEHLQCVVDYEVTRADIIEDEVLK